MIVRRIILLSFAFLFMLSCDIKKNNSCSNSIINKINDKVIDIRLQKIAEIKIDSLNIERLSINTIRFGVIYEDSFILYDQNDNMFKIIDYSNNILSTIGRKGKGPGELLNPTEMAIQNDTLFVYDGSQLKIVKYSLKDKKEITEIRLENITFSNLKSFPNNNFICNDYKMIQENNQLYLNFRVVIYSNDFQEVSVLKTETVNYNPLKPMNPFDYPVYNFATSDKIIALPLNGSDLYSVEIWDRNESNILTSFTMPYKRIKYSKDELKKINDALKEMMASYNAKFNADSRYKKSISDVVIDRFERIWIKAANNEHNHYDLFENGVFLGRLRFSELSKIKDTELITQEDKLIIYGSKKVIIYQYDYEI